MCQIGRGSRRAGENPVCFFLRLAVKVARAVKRAYPRTPRHPRQKKRTADQTGWDVRLTGHRTHEG